MTITDKPCERLTFDPAAELMWQNEAIEMLEAVRSQGFYSELPALDWTVTSIGILKGSVPAETVDADAVLAAWVDVADANPPETFVYGGCRNLRAYARKVYGSWVLLELSARIDADGVAR